MVEFLFLSLHDFQRASSSGRRPPIQLSASKAHPNFSCFICKNNEKDVYGTPQPLWLSRILPSAAIIKAFRYFGTKLTALYRLLSGFVWHWTPEEGLIPLNYEEGFISVNPVLPA